MELSKKLAEAVGRDRYDLWIASDAKLQCEANSRTGASDVQIQFASGFMCDLARRNLGRELASAVKQLYGSEATLTLRVAEPAASATARACAAATAKPATPIVTPAVPRTAATAAASPPARPVQTFASLVIGKANDLAARAAQQIAHGRSAGGPLVVWGPPGSGKTHLLSAVRCAFREQFPRARVLALTAEQFVGHYVEAYRGGGLPSFRQKYRGANLLILDDLHFMAGKKATLEELHHTFDRITTAGGQVVVASLQEPAKIPRLSEELLSRLRAGLVCEVKAADFATRLEIARRRCQTLRLPIDEEPLRRLATGVIAGARELLGAIERLRARHELLGEAIDGELIEQTVAEISRQTIRPMAMDDIQKAVCSYYGVEPKALRSNSRSKSVTEPRMLAMWLARKFTQAGWREIGEYFGGRSHSTVISAHRRIESRMGESSTDKCAGGNSSLEEAVVQIESALRTA